MSDQDGDRRKACETPAVDADTYRNQRWARLSDIAR